MLKDTNKEYYCSLEFTMDIIGGKWKTMMIYFLKDGAQRSSDLQRMLRDCSNKMFTQTIRELERDGLVHREVFPVVPPRVEYSLTPKGESFLPIIMQMSDWGEEVAEQEGIVTIWRKKSMAE